MEPSLNSLTFDKYNTLRKSTPNPENKLINLNLASLLPPPNPLLIRKNIPINSPRFGKNITYIKLNPFLTCEKEKEELNPPLTSANTQKEQINIIINSGNSTNESKSSDPSDEKFEKNLEIGAYVNFPSMLEKLVYSRTDLTKEGKLNIDNIVNLKKKNSEIPKKNKIVKPFYTLKDSKDTTLLFESRFESGNLLASYKISDFNYQLVIQNDSNTNGYSQWFFFRVSNTQKGTKVKLNIVNLLKKYSLYKKGMKILIYSEKKAANEKIGWHRGGGNINYYSNSLYKFVRETKRHLYSLTFNYEFEYDNDVVYFANSLPYTYTDLMRELNEFKKNEMKYDFLTRKSLCVTLAGNNLEYFTITSHEKGIPIEEREGVVLMARVHPGETVGSHMMKGVIDFLTGDSQEALYLRNHFVFKVIPMMNPDGVICGNYRTSLAGCDLNRRWANPNEILHPEILSAKQMILKLASQRKISFICDFHGHSGAHNIFMYGNHIKDQPYLCKIFPFLLSKVNSTFNFGQCAFKMTKDKMGTARINLFNELEEFNNIFTIEASFSGSNKGPRANMHFNSVVLNEMGRDICLTLINYHRNYSKSAEKLYDEMKIESEIRDKIKKERKEQKEEKVMNNSCVSEKEDSEEESEGSDSEPSFDNIEKDVLVKLLPTQAKKKKAFSKKPKPSVIPTNKNLNGAKKSKDANNINMVKPSVQVFPQTTNVVPKFIIKNKSPAQKIKIKNKSEVNQEPTLDRNISNSDLIKDTIKNVSLKINVPNNILDGQKSKLQVVKKKDQETQTEDEFFKSHWSVFQNRFVILSAKMSKNIILSTNFPHINKNSTEKQSFSFFNNVSNANEQPQYTKYSPSTKISVSNRNVYKNTSKIVFSLGKK